MKGTKFIAPSAKYNRRMRVVGDKSVTQRAIIFHAVASGSAKITGANLGQDCLSALDCVNKLGARTHIEDGNIFIEAGQLLPNQILNAQNSATSARLLCGLLAGRVDCQIIGDSSLSLRPMGRIIEPLRSMGARIDSNNGRCPLSLTKSKLNSIDYTLPIASAQVKSAIALAGLDAVGQTIIRENCPSRDHTEIMLSHMGADLTYKDGVIRIKKSRLRARDIEVLGDFSASAYYLARALLGKDCHVTVERVGVNPTRTGILDYIKHRKANQAVVCGEQACDITVESAEVLPFEVEAQDVAKMIDEIPLLAIIACFARGKSIIRGLSELRFKECDRLTATHDLILATGGKASICNDDLIIEGNGGLRGGTEFDCRNDHRMAMTASVVARASTEGLTLKNCATEISDPHFFELI